MSTDAPNNPPNRDFALDAGSAKDAPPGVENNDPSIPRGEVDARQLRTSVRPVRLSARYSSGASSFSTSPLTSALT